VRRQSGLVLFISLVLLLVLTITGLSGVQTTSLEQRMARNAHDRMLAFQAAESALRDAERFVADPEIDVREWPPIGLLFTASPAARWRTAETTIGGVAAPAHYVVEHITTLIHADDAYSPGDPYRTAAPARVEIFRLTARGTGASGAVHVTLQSTFARYAADGGDA
jgi:type IV pilus assembly protein PilX